MATKKTMSSEDRILWGKVARSVRALPGRMEFFEDFETEEAEQAKGASGMPVFSPKDTATTSVPASPRPEHRHHPIERPVQKKIAKGRLQLEARIDLHGLVQSEAHAMLLGFLVHAHERGLRHVLVITGKGSSMGSEGALKRAVPLWFSKPEFRFLISGYEAASRGHGGEGALYVRLARKPGDKS
ncbi:Smr/MutS family protein [Rhizobium sp. C4]|uniref:Smr/MutS family protein n=1 Tax=Rhizobium sp. C4 TaxID=1349800 RepID=UPI001E5ED07C|nr:Smr/MutS family protein [Rhizobium sp. C4]MCD2174686.1 Smr/MutS family protein [Rhizobium sp. C4]